MERLAYCPGEGFLCRGCYSAPVTQTARGTIVYVGNKEYPKMTHAMMMNIKTRRVRGDGKIRPDARWRDSYEGRR